MVLPLLQQPVVFGPPSRGFVPALPLQTVAFAQLRCVVAPGLLPQALLFVPPAHGMVPGLQQRLLESGQPL